jgi:hypothetical protein
MVVQRGGNNPSVCHSELCCESLFWRPEILRFAQNDKFKESKTAGKLPPRCSSSSTIERL